MHENISNDSSEPEFVEGTDVGFGHTPKHQADKPTGSHAGKPVRGFKVHSAEVPLLKDKDPDVTINSPNNDET